MLMLRVITAFVLLVVLCFSVWAGPLCFAGVMAIGFGLALYEWLRIGNLGPVPAALVSAVEMITQFSLYWAGALPRMEWFLFIVNGLVMIAWIVIFFAELFHRSTGFKVTVPQCVISAVVFVPALFLSAERMRSPDLRSLRCDAPFLRSGSHRCPLLSNA